MKRALLSVSDKTDILWFAKELINLGYEILSTGGTATTLKENGLKVTEVSEVTGFQECLDGRVKTLHPMIHGGILNIRDNEEHQKQIKELGIEPIDLVCINLYPFKETVEKGSDFATCIENIDIGGPAMIRSSAKNFKDVVVVTDPRTYEDIIEKLKTDTLDYQNRLELALAAFELTAHYDATITSYFKRYVEDYDRLPDNLTLAFEKVQELRYGENPHQQAAFYREIEPFEGSLVQSEQLQGKELSYNNINDTNGAIEILKEYFIEPTIVAVKHANPCAVSSETTISEAFRKAYEADPTSIFGGIIASNTPIDEDTANQMKDIFLEVVVAPDYTDEALEVFKQKPNLRILRLPGIMKKQKANEYKSVVGGLLVQDNDLDNIETFRVVTDRKPTEEEIEDLLFAWKAVKGTKSNAITVAKDKTIIGVGPGQVNRVWPTEHALRQAGEEAEGAVLASDAFFPFDDCVTLAADAGITAIIQPGGSVRDEDSIKVANENGIAMIFTDMRHFKHS